MEGNYAFGEINPMKIFVVLKFLFFRKIVISDLLLFKSEILSLNCIWKSIFKEAMSSKIKNSRVGNFKAVLFDFRFFDKFSQQIFF